MSDVGKIMDTAQVSSPNALFAGLQAAVMCLVDMNSGIGGRMTLDRVLDLVQEALEVGGPYGSPERLAHEGPQNP